MKADDGGMLLIDTNAGLEKYLIFSVDMMHTCLYNTISSYAGIMERMSTISGCRTIGGPNFDDILQVQGLAACNLLFSNGQNGSAVNRKL